jgi:hypothetical protein
VPAIVLAAVPSNVEGGSYMTFAGPILTFCIIGAILYVRLFARPHPRVPPRLAATAHAGALAQATSASGTTAAAAPEAHQETTTTDNRGNVSGGTPDGEQGTSEDTEAGE